MESQDQVSASGNSVSENEGIQLQIRDSSDTLSFELNDPDSPTEHSKEIKYASDEVGYMLKTDKDKVISSTESSNAMAELKSEAAQDESRNVSVEKEESLCLLTESSDMSTNKEKCGTIPDAVGNISREKDQSQAIASEALPGGEKFETTSKESSFSSSSFDDKALSHANRLAPSDNLTQQPSDGANVLKYTEKASQTFSSSTESKSSLRSVGNQHEEPNSLSNVSSNTSSTGEVLPVESLQSLCIRESLSNVSSNRLPADIIREVREMRTVLDSNLVASIGSNASSTDRDLLVESLRSLRMPEKDTEHLHVEADSINEKSETNHSLDKLQPSTRASETAGDKSVTIKNSAYDVEATGVKNTSNDGTADTTDIASRENVMNEQLRITTEIACEETVICQKTITEIVDDKTVSDKHSADTPEIFGGKNVAKEHSNIASNIEILHLKQDENVTSEQVTTAKTAAEEVVTTETADVGTSEADPHPGETEEDSERRAFFYMSSCSVPGMGKEWEWPSVSCEYQYQRPTRRMERHRNAAESRNCLGTQRCHYIILAVGVLGAILGCLTYHLQDYGIGPKVLRPIGASAAFLSFVVCAFSSVYLTYLSYYTNGQSSRNYRLLDASDPAASMLIDTMPQGYNSDPRFYFTSSAAATAQQVLRETQSADALDRQGYSWYQTGIKRPFDGPGPSGYDPDSKRFIMDPTTSEGEIYEMKSMRRISEKDGCKERNLSQASDSSHYTLAHEVYHSNSNRESENTENTPLLQKK